MTCSGWCKGMLVAQPVAMPSAPLIRIRGTMGTMQTGSIWIPVNTKSRQCASQMYEIVVCCLICLYQIHACMNTCCSNTCMQGRTCTHQHRHSVVHPSIYEYESKSIERL